MRQRREMKYKIINHNWTGEEYIKVQICAFKYNKKSGRCRETGKITSIALTGKYKDVVIIKNKIAGIFY